MMVNYDYMLPGRGSYEMRLLGDVLNDMVAQSDDDSHRWFPKTAGNLSHAALCLGGEVGEFQNKVKKIDRGSVTFDEARAELLDELADVFTYFLDTASIVGLDIMKAYYIKREINEKRFGHA
jgi:NTP pyrophosphatase (non-canonical NTP hydrolase)